MDTRNFLYYNPAILKTEYRSREASSIFFEGAARNRWTGPDESGNLRVLSGQTIQTPRGMKALTSSERVYPDHGLNSTRLEDSKQVGQRIRKGLRQLCQSLFYIAALKLYTAAGRLRQEERPSVPAGAPSSGFDARAEEKVFSNAISLVGKVLGSLPTKENHVSSLSAIEVFVSKLREEVLEFAAADKAEQKPPVPRFGRKAKVTRSPGLENLKVTLNLARGDLESSFAF